MAGKLEVVARAVAQDLPEEPLLGECDGKILICCEKSRQGWIWDRSDSSMRELKVANDYMGRVSISPKHRWFAAACGAREQSVKVWRFGDAVQEPIEEPEGLTFGYDLSFSWDGRFMASAYLFEDTIVESIGVMSSLGAAFSPDGEWLPDSPGWRSGSVANRIRRHLGLHL